MSYCHGDYHGWERFFQPRRLDTLRPEARAWAGKWVRVRSWHSNMAMRETHPDDELVGYVVEFGMDIPESELLVSASRAREAQP